MAGKDRKDRKKSEKKGRKKKTTPNTPRTVYSRPILSVFYVKQTSASSPFSRWGD